MGRISHQPDAIPAPPTKYGVGVEASCSTTPPVPDWMAARAPDRCAIYRSRSRLPRRSSPGLSSSLSKWSIRVFPGAAALVRTARRSLGSSSYVRVRLPWGARVQGVGDVGQASCLAVAEYLVRVALGLSANNDQPAATASDDLAA
jgi:hypothetical protein